MSNFVKEIRKANKERYIKYLEECEEKGTLFSRFMDWLEDKVNDNTPLKYNPKHIDRKID